jgi:hypothetical protein
MPGIGPAVMSATWTTGHMGQPLASTHTSPQS